MRDLRARLDALPLRRDARPERATAVPRDRPFEVREQRIDLATLGLTVVAQSEPDPHVVTHLGLKGASPSRWEDIVFLDTETTGLMGGTGTYVFLLGSAHIQGGELVLRQHLLNGLGYEREFVEAISLELARFRACASYNGKCFDLPLLRTRFIMALRADLNVDDSHLDLLHPARRLWRGRFGSTSLRQLEDSVLDIAREDDIPGSLIPERYFRYLATADAALIEPVLRHNARDIVSLVQITDRVARAVIDARAGRAPDHAPAAFALACAFERAGEPDVAYLCYESAYAEADSELRVRVALPYARALERRGHPERAFGLIELLLGLGLGSPRWREQAEGRTRRLSRIMAKRCAPLRTSPTRPRRSAVASFPAAS
ncbi:MAG TPA: ribonuclease H-like domain-containing protein [Candidatus Limnocylindria bacterium]|nr:ribonuclease H-like domain-containing protein [Candidatus Limnocylindria bacterium]